MDIGSIVAIVVALLSVAGGIWMQVIQFKKDSGKISEVKADTNELKPKTDHIEKGVDRLQVGIEHLVPTAQDIKRVSEQSSQGILKLVEELNYQQRLKNELSVDLQNKDRFLGGIEKLYEENSRLSNHIRELVQERDIQINRCFQLKRENANLRKENRELSEELSSYKERENPRGYDHVRGFDLEP